jgi:hypothetical protein
MDVTACQERIMNVVVRPMLQMIHEFEMESYTDNDVASVQSILNNYVEALATLHDPCDDEIMAQVKSVVLKLNELNEALENLDHEAEDFFEKHDAAMQAVDDYLKTLPIAYSEEFTAEPLTDEEMASMQGKSLSQLTEEGFEIGSNGTEPSEDEEEILIVYSLRYGVYDYNCVVDADFDQYIAAQDNGAEGDLVVKSMSLAGITEWSFEKRFHTDGTVDEPKDPSAEFSEIMAEMLPFFEKIQAGEEIDIQDFADALKAKYPDYADMIDMYVTLYQTYGLDGFSSMMNFTE